MITQRDLSRLGNRLYEDAKAVHGKKALRVAEDAAERDYCHAWWLCRLPSHDTLNRSLKRRPRVYDHLADPTYKSLHRRKRGALRIQALNNPASSRNLHRTVDDLSTVVFPSLQISAE
jgi:hypothetical protein